MLTTEQIRKIQRLASVLATARVRRFAIINKLAKGGETIGGISTKVQNAETELEKYLRTLAPNMPTQTEVDILQEMVNEAAANVGLLPPEEHEDYLRDVAIANQVIARLR